MPDLKIIKDNATASDRIRAEVARVAAELAETNAKASEEQATASVNALSVVTFDRGFSGDDDLTVVPTTSGASENNISWYLNNESLQIIRLESGAWQDFGEPVTTKKYVDDKASLLGVFAPDSTDKADWQAAIAKAISTGRKFIVPQGNHTISGDLLIDSPLHVYVTAGAKITMQNAPNITHGIKNNQGTSTGFAMFIFNSSAEGSIFECYGKIDMNGSNSGTDPQGDINAPIGVWAYGCHKFQAKGILNVVKANNSLSIVDSDDTSVDVVYTDEGVPEFSAGSVVVVEGVKNCKIDTIIAKNYAEPIDYNNQNDNVEIENIYAENCDETIDINFSVNIRIGRVIAKNNRVYLNAASESGARYAQRTIESDGYFSLGDFYGFLDGDTTKDYSTTTALISQTNYGARVNIENLQMRIEADFEGVLPDRVALLSSDRGHINASFTFLREIVDGVAPIRFSGLTASDINLDVRGYASQDTPLVEIGAGTGSIFQSLYLRDDSANTGTIGINNETTSAYHIASVNALNGFETDLSGKFSFGYPVFRYENDLPDTSLAQSVWNRDTKKPMWFDGTNWLYADGRPKVKGEALTISAGAITVDSTYHQIDTEGAAASDDLETINSSGYNEGDQLFLRVVNSSRDVILKHNTGNIQTRDGTDITMGSAQDVVHLMYDDNDNWRVVAS